MTRDFLERTAQTVPDGAEIDVAPVLHPFQLSEMLTQSPVLRRRGIRLHAYDADQPRHAGYLLVFCRLADLAPDLQQLVDEQSPLVEERRSGVLLAGLYQQGQ